MKLNDYIVCCSWHEPRNAVVKMKTGEIVPASLISRIPDDQKRDQIIHSGGFCNPCAERFMKGKQRAPLVEAAPMGVRPPRV